MKQSEVLDEIRAAQYLGCTVHALRAWRFRRVGPPWYKVGRLVRYRVSDLDQFLTANRVEPEAEVKR